ncbi:hypothetical protein [Spiroplasma endosymbiont of Glossina fuscipes fuscipes]|uniref:hypothetical protein n=1 Tax=Spiroplasma endosymbiont of Glossina fuscipes fuscipes TaxID=2004463 RepID=UPI003C744F63
MFNFNKFSVNIYENALNQLKEKIEGTDDIIFKKRDKTKYFVKEIKTRKIKTEFGILIYREEFINIFIRVSENMFLLLINNLELKNGKE